MSSGDLYRFGSGALTRHPVGVGQRPPSMGNDGVERAAHLGRGLLWASPGIAWRARASSGIWFYYAQINMYVEVKSTIAEPVRPIEGWAKHSAAQLRNYV